MLSVDFYPHSCSITDDGNIDPSTGKVNKVIKYSGECCLTEGTTSVKGQILQGKQKLLIPDSSVVLEKGYVVDVTLENGSKYSAVIYQSYPISDADIGGQELSLDNGE